MTLAAAPDAGGVISHADRACRTPVAGAVTPKSDPGRDVPRATLSTRRQSTCDDARHNHTQGISRGSGVTLALLGKLRRTCHVDLDVACMGVCRTGRDGEAKLAR